MAEYQSQSTGDIGNLLRLIQQEKASSVLNQPPGSQPGAPVRSVVQSPLQSAEAPGSSRVVSTPAEGSPNVVAPGGTGGTVASSGIVAPAVPVPPIAPAPAPSGVISPGRAATPSQPSSSGGSSPASSPQPSLGTSISAAPAIQSTPVSNNNGSTQAQLQQILKQFFQSFLGPAVFGGSIGQPSVQKPGPTPTPRPGQPWVG